VGFTWLPPSEQATLLWAHSHRISGTVSLFRVVSDRPSVACTFR